MPMGRTLFARSQVLPTRVSADGNPKYKAGGVMIDLSTIPAASGTDTTLQDGSIIKAGQQYMRYGQILTKITSSEVQSLAIGGIPTGGDFTLAVNGQTTAAITFSTTEATTAANIDAALEALSTIGAGNVTVTSPGTDSFVITFAAALGNVGPITATLTGLTGGSGYTATIATTHAGESYGKFGPYDPAATDGRASLVRGDAFILDETWFYYPAESALLSAPNDFIGGVFEAGDVWKDRILQSGVAAHTLAAGPTLAEFETLFPRISYYKN
jgi:hypothetical protein